MQSNRDGREDHRDGDAKLVDLARRGDTAAFARLVERSEPAVLRFCRRLMTREAAAEDLAQETFLRAFQSLDRLEEPDRFGAWLFGIAAHVAKWWWRRQARWPVSLDALRAAYPDVAWEATLLSPLSPEDVIGEAEQRQRLLGAVDALPDELGHVVALHYLHGLSYAEVAEALAVPVSTVKGRLFKSRARLRRELLTWEPGDARPQDRERRGKRERMNSVVEQHGDRSVSLVPVTVASIRSGAYEPAPEAVLKALQQWPVVAQVASGGAVEGAQPAQQPDLTPAAEHLADALGQTDVKVPETTSEVTLQEQAGTRVVPITVGAWEGLAIATHMQGIVPDRPMPHDLTLRVLDAGGLRVQHVAVIRLEKDTYYAAISVQRPDGATLEIDSRPSDAIGIAVRAGVPIFAADELFHDPAEVDTKAAEAQPPRLRYDVRPRPEK